MLKYEIITTTISGVNMDHSVPVRITPREKKTLDYRHHKGGSRLWKYDGSKGEENDSYSRVGNQRIQDSRRTHDGFAIIKEVEISDDDIWLFNESEIKKDRSIMLHGQMMAELEKECQLALKEANWLNI